MQFVRDGAGSGRKDEVRAGERDAQRGRALPPERMMMNAGHGCEQEPQCRGNRESSLRHKSGTKDVALQALKPRLRTPRRPRRNIKADQAEAFLGPGQGSESKHLHPSTARTVVQNSAKATTGHASANMASKGHLSFAARAKQHSSVLVKRLFAIAGM